MEEDFYEGFFLYELLCVPFEKDLNLPQLLLYIIFSDKFVHLENVSLIN